MYVSVYPIYVTAAVALWLERPLCEREIVGSIPGRDRPKSLKLVVVAFPPWSSGLWEQYYDWQHNGLVKYWLKLVQETWICELSPSNNRNTFDTA